MIDLEAIPEKTGVYIFKDSEGRIIYVGKANSLRQRVRQYFFGNQDTRPQVEFIKKETESIEYRLTSSEEEALILEYNLISSGRPKYNVKLKDSNKYPYIVLSGDEYPYLHYLYSMDEKFMLFGPYTSGLYVKTFVERLNRIFRLRVCRTKLPSKTCIEFQMGNCSGVCVYEEEKKIYKEKIGKIKKILSGGTGEIISALEEEMKIMAENEDFESAAVIRDTIGFVKKEMRRGKKTGIKGGFEDVFAMSREKNSGAFSILKLRNGTVRDIITKRFSAKELLDDKTVGEEILSEYYLTTTDFEFRKLIVPFKDEIVLETLEKKGIEIKSFTQGSFERELYETAQENARNTLCLYTNKRFVSKGVMQLKEDLKLKRIPDYIIGLDISHVNGEWTSGAVVSFRDGKPLKSAYRYYNLEEIGNNDYLALSTILKRYLEKHPADMIIIDGGLGQLSSCMRVIEELGKDAEVFALAKRFDTLYDSSSKEIMINGRTAGAALIRAIRDESHRFANKLRKIKMERMKKDGRKKKDLS